MCTHIDRAIQLIYGPYTAELTFQTLLLEIIWLFHMPKTMICKMLRYSSLLAHLFQHTYTVFKMYLPTGVLVNHGFDRLDGISGSDLK